MVWGSTWDGLGKHLGWFGEAPGMVWGNTWDGLGKLDHQVVLR